MSSLWQPVYGGLLDGEHRVYFKRNEEGLMKMRRLGQVGLEVFALGRRQCLGL